MIFTVPPGNAEELVRVLLQANNGDQIHLSGRTYHLHVQLEKHNVDNVVLQGVEGSDTVVKGQIKITGNSCRLQGFSAEPLNQGAAACDGIEIIGNNNVVRNVQISGFYKALDIRGNCNRVEDMILKDVRSGMHITGDHNQIVPNELENCSVEGILINNNKNILNNIKLVNVYRGVIINGSDNEISYCQYIINATAQEISEGLGHGCKRVSKGPGHGCIGFRLGNGMENLLHHLDCVGVTDTKFGDRNYGVVIQSAASFHNSTITLSKIGNVLMQDGAMVSSLTF